MVMSDHQHGERMTVIEYHRTFQIFGNCCVPEPAANTQYAVSEIWSLRDRLTISCGKHSSCDMKTARNEARRFRFSGSKDSKDTFLFAVNELHFISRNDKLFILVAKYKRVHSDRTRWRFIFNWLCPLLSQALVQKCLDQNTRSRSDRCNKPIPYHV